MILCDQIWRVSINTHNEGNVFVPGYTTVIESSFYDNTDIIEIQDDNVDNILYQEFLDQEEYIIYPDEDNEHYLCQEQEDQLYYQQEEEAEARRLKFRSAPAQI
jgi:hypothetical protein